MYTYIEERVREIASYIIESGATVRAAAKKFKVSKSTVHKDMAERLKQVDPAAAKQVNRVLQQNKQERHIRGGMATHLKYRGEM